MRRSWPVILWLTVITVTSSTVIQSRAFTHAVATKSPIHLSESRFASFWNQWWWVFVKGYHVLEFALLAILIERALPRRYLTVLMLTLMAAALDEYHQTFVPARGGRITDWLIDGVGALIALNLLALIRRRNP